MSEKVDHVVYVDAKSKEMEKLLDGSKSMIIRWATWRKLPYDRVNIWDTLYFINNNGEGLVKVKAIVSTVFNSEKMETEQSVELVKSYQDKLQLSDSQFKKRWWKRYIVLIWIENIEQLESFEIDKSEFGNMDDWLLVGDIWKVKK